MVEHSNMAHSLVCVIDDVSGKTDNCSLYMIRQVTQVRYFIEASVNTNFYKCYNAAKERASSRLQSKYLSI
jgi:hypothetical protein